MTETTPEVDPTSAESNDSVEVHDTVTVPDGHPSAEAARYRTRLRETEAERDSIAGRLTGYQRAEAERLASAGLSKASDLWLDGLDVAELLDDDGQVDAEKVTAQVAAVLDGRPGLAAVRVPRLQPDPTQGSTAGAAATDSGWATILRGGRR